MPEILEMYNYMCVLCSGVVLSALCGVLLQPHAVYLHFQADIKATECIMFVCEQLDDISMEKGQTIRNNAAIQSDVGTLSEGVSRVQGLSARRS